LPPESGPDATSSRGEPGAAASGAPAPKAKAGSAEERAARKTLARLDKQLERVAVREAELNAQVLEHAQDYEKLAELGAELQAVAAEKEQLELEWLEAAELLE
jgi:ATP-binding cassette subfamily F protein uup